MLVHGVGRGISIHAPVKGATAPVARLPRRGRISIHAPVKGATCADWIARPDFDFNPRSREGSDARWRVPDGYVMISIHAPVKGATMSLLSSYCSGQISIHAPVKGATWWRLYVMIL